MTIDIPRGEKLYILLLSLVAFTVPLPMLLNNMAIIFITLYWLFLLVNKELVRPNIKTFLIITLPYSILLFGGLNSSNLEQFGTELTKSIPFLLYPLIFFTVPYKLTPNQFKTVLMAFVGGNVVVAFFLLGVIGYKTILGGLSMQTLWSLTHQTLSAHVSLNAIYLSLFLVVSMIITTHYFLNREAVRRPRQKIGFVSIMLLFVVVLIFLSSRSILLSGAAIVGLMFFKYYLENERFLKVLLRFVLAGVFISIVGLTINPVLKWRIESVVGMQDTNFTVGKEEGILMRKRLWSSSVEVFKDNWLFGVGSGDFNDELKKVYQKEKYRIQFRRNMNSHNQYLSYLVSNGIIGLFLFIFYMFYPMRMYFKRKLWMSFFITILFVLSFITESYLYTNKGVAVVAFFMTFLFNFSCPTITKTFEKTKSI